jgi:hypothetical protein
MKIRPSPVDWSKSATCPRTLHGLEMLGMSSTFREDCRCQPRTIQWHRDRVSSQVDVMHNGRIDIPLENSQWHSQDASKVHMLGSLRLKRRKGINNAEKLTTWIGEASKNLVVQGRKVVLYRKTSRIIVFL